MRRVLGGHLGLDSIQASCDAEPPLKAERCTVTQTDRGRLNAVCRAQVRRAAARSRRGAAAAQYAHVARPDHQRPLHAVPAVCARRHARALLRVHRPRRLRPPRAVRLSRAWRLAGEANRILARRYRRSARPASSSGCTTRQASTGCVCMDAAHPRFGFVSASNGRGCLTQLTGPCAAVRVQWFCVGF